MSGIARSIASPIARPLSSPIASGGGVPAVPANAVTADGVLVTANGEQVTATG